MARIGAYARDDLSHALWPWLKSCGYATDNDDAVFDTWVRTQLGKRSAFFRAGLRLRRRCRPDETPASLREEVDAILRAGGDEGLRW